MAGSISAVEGRRFTAVGFRHPSLRSPDSAHDVISNFCAGSNQVLASGQWDIRKVEFLHRSSLYPEQYVDPEERRRKDVWFAHDLFVAHRQLPNFGPALWVSSPYVRLLDGFKSALEHRLGPPDCQYVGVEVDRMYSLLVEADPTALSVRRVILRILTDKNVQLVSLTGQSPLHSKLHATLSKSTLPYGAGVQVSIDGLHARVTVDRTGALHWFQSNVDTMRCAWHLLDQLDEVGALRGDRYFPLTLEARKDSQDEQTEIEDFE